MNTFYDIKKVDGNILELDWSIVKEHLSADSTPVIIIDTSINTKGDPIPDLVVRRYSEEPQKNSLADYDVIHRISGEFGERAKRNLRDFLSKNCSQNPKYISEEASIFLGLD